jgi:hypothetical protein
MFSGLTAGYQSCYTSCWTGNYRLTYVDRST